MDVETAVEHLLQLLAAADFFAASNVIYRKYFESMHFKYRWNVDILDVIYCELNFHYFSNVHSTTDLLRNFNFRSGCRPQSGSTLRNCLGKCQINCANYSIEKSIRIR